VLGWNRRDEPRWRPSSTARSSTCGHWSPAAVPLSGQVAGARTDLLFLVEAVLSFSRARVSGSGRHVCPPVRPAFVVATAGRPTCPATHALVVTADVVFLDAPWPHPGTSLIGSLRRAGRVAAARWLCSRAAAPWTLFPKTPRDPHGRPPTSGAGAAADLLPDLPWQSSSGGADRTGGSWKLCPARLPSASAASSRGADAEAGGYLVRLRDADQPC